MSDDAPEQALPDLAAVEADLNAVERALKRLDEGSYGRCSVCGEPLAEHELEQNPLAERCDAHAVVGDLSVVDRSAQTAWGSGGVAST